MSTFAAHWFLRGYEVGPTVISITSHVKMRHMESLKAKIGCQALQGGQILVHDLLWSELSHAHRVLLETAHKVFEHAANPYLRQEVVSGNVTGK